MKAIINDFCDFCKHDNEFYYVVGMLNTIGDTTDSSYNSECLQ